jgi:hypothetical protein
MHSSRGVHVPDVLQVLKDEAVKKNMYNPDEPWRTYVGILFDEIKVKSELVYDKNSGELIGYCNHCIICFY